MSKAAPFVVALLAIAAARAEDTPPVRDPMRPFGSVAAAAAAAAKAPRFAMTAVLIAPSRRVAIVNGKPYAQGATVDGAEIVAIEHDVVRLRERGAELVIHLGRPGDGRPQSVQGETVP
ncbi:MAG TPA: hypothetical protein VM692_13365 [Gammaproteobacteria bacterium]|nr:hypothetical protein [Gammaproteobacteria bacterium]